MPSSFDSSILLKPTLIDGIKCKNKVVMAPLTQMQASPANDFIPSPLAREYYSQRASTGAGLIIVGATQICLGQGYPLTPGIYLHKQTAGWKDIIKAVHEKVRINIQCHLSIFLFSMHVPMH